MPVIVIDPDLGKQDIFREGAGWMVYIDTRSEFTTDLRAQNEKGEAVDPRHKQLLEDIPVRIRETDYANFNMMPWP